MSRFVYADNAATTAVSKPVFEAMAPYFTAKYGNPSSIYSIGREAREAVDTARLQTAAALGAKREEIFFTSGGSEADNWAIRGFAEANAEKGRHIVTSVIEHHAVLHTFKALEKEGFETTALGVNSEGFIDPDALRAAIRPDTTLVTLMAANNEIGTVEPVTELARVCHENGVCFHTDAVQAVGHEQIDVTAQAIDMLSLSAHKFHGPKGVGALYVKSGLKFPNLIEGGAQEKGRRAGTENVAGIVGLGRAIELAAEHLDENNAAVLKMREKLIDGILKTVPDVRLNGSREKRLPGNANFAFGGVQGESLLVLLDMEGICASAGSACNAGSLDPSHVLTALGLPEALAHGSLRLTLDEENTMEDVDYILEVLPRIVARLRALAPAW